MTWEAARFQLAAYSAGVCAVFTFFNLIWSFLRLVRRRRVSSVPFVGSGFGIVALIAMPASLRRGLVLGVLTGFVVVECLNCYWPASLDAPAGPEDRT